MEYKKLGLALGSGSARGLAHIGVLQVFEEQGIPIDMIAGCSMGAVVGGVYACGTDIHMIEKFIEHMNERDFFDFVLPRRGFIKGGKFKDLIGVFTKGRDFEDTLIPFCCIATDIHRGELHVLNKGSVLEAIRASMAIPAVFEPQIIDGVTYVDGSVLDRVPCKAAREMGAEVVIGVDVGFRGVNEGRPELSSDSITEIIMSCLDIMQWEISKKADVHCELMLAPQVQHINPNTAAQSSECIRIGRQAALDALPRILELVRK